MWLESTRLDSELPAAGVCDVDNLLPVLPLTSALPFVCLESYNSCTLRFCITNSLTFELFITFDSGRKSAGEHGFWSDIAGQLSTFKIEGISIAVFF